MKTHLHFLKQFILLASALMAFAAINLPFTNSFAQGTTAFTFQGRLNTATNPANGSYDMTFAVYDANVGGDLIAGPITNSAVAVSNGLFTVTLDFGPGVFTGTNYWVQMGVSQAGAGTFATLVPRQQLTPTPYALCASSVVNGAISYQQLAPRAVGTTVPTGGVAISPLVSWGNTTSPNQWTTVPNLSVTITTTGRPVMILLAGDVNLSASETATQSELFGQTLAPTTAEVDVACMRDGLYTGSPLTQQDRGSQLCIPSPGNFRFLDTPPAGSHTYQIQIQGGLGSSNNSTSVGVNAVRLIVYEL